MARPTRVQINAAALLHNVSRVKQYAPGKKIIAMVKANAYGCGLAAVTSVLEGHVDAFGVACIEEAMKLRAIGSRTPCILFQGIFHSEELYYAASYELQCVLHDAHQLKWLLETRLPRKIKIWVKVNTGMNRLGFFPDEVMNVIGALMACPWVDKDIGLISHFACADEPQKKSNQQQLTCFNNLSIPKNAHLLRSMANSAAIIALPDSHADVVRPGIMLYGISPFPNQIGTELGLIPVMRLTSAISAIRLYSPQTSVGYGGTWQSDKQARIGMVAIGYGDGYPRHILPNTPTWVNGQIAPIVGRISMDMLTVDLTNCSTVEVGDEVELWGIHVPVETIAKSAGTIAYELICQTSSRAHGS